MKMRNLLIGTVAVFLIFSIVPAFAATTMTRYEAASRLAQTLSTVNFDGAGGEEDEILKKLVLEFRKELEVIGVKILDQRFASLVSADVGAQKTPDMSETLPSGHWVYGALAWIEVAAQKFAGPSPRVMEQSASNAPASYNRTKATVPYLGYAGENRFAQSSSMISLASIPRPSPQETARYSAYDDNPVKIVARDPLSTFSLDVSTASYANVRRFLNAGRMPHPDAVRVEELINYFPAMAQDMTPTRLEGSPFAAACELAPCPWNDNNVLLWVSLTTQELDYKKAPPANLVFLVDVSGSMSPPERLPLVKAALKMLTARLRPEDRISLVTYAGSTRVALEATKGSEKASITAAIDGLGAGGSTAGAAGLTLAYQQARGAFIKGGVNRILLCTDGDFNVGASSTEELEAMVKKERESGVTLSILGFGTDNYNDAMMTKIASVGNGNCSYVDGMSEARKVLDEEMTATLVTVAKDVKAQIEFNPANVIEYRQIGYEKRQLRNEDFNNDKIDAGDVGAGRRVTILYELTLVGAKPSVDPLRYQASPAPASDDAASTDMKGDELAYLKFRWKAPDGDVSSRADMPVLKKSVAKTFAGSGTGLRFTAAVAAYGQKLRNGPGLEGMKWSAIESWADGARGDDPWRAEFLQLVKLAASISGANASSGADASSTGK
ncbi:MAG: VWA domain-containing protein [Synergistaceae bacterium]|jgi:Ca-activated chloride channel family protein|nr:VWA domain-containing protein [Synergistaceae bacterium]